MKAFFESEIFAITFTFLVYFLATQLQQKVKLIILNPILISIAIIILFLSVFKINYSYYHEGGKIIEFFLKPAVVALGVPLYLQLGRIKKQALQIIVSQLVGCIAGVVSVVLIAKLMGVCYHTHCDGSSAYHWGYSFLNGLCSSGGGYLRCHIWIHLTKMVSH
jgi:putative effector of murein hydrolase